VRPVEIHELRPHACHQEDARATVALELVWDDGSDNVSEVAMDDVFGELKLKAGAAIEWKPIRGA